MQFKSYEEILKSEREQGHDHLLASCYNFASPDEQEDGVATYIGQGDDIGDRCVLFIDRNGSCMLALTNGHVVAQEFQLQDRLDLVSFCSWVTALT